MNVVGAGAAMSSERILLRDCFSGDHVDRPRLFEANFKLVVDEAISTRGMARPAAHSPGKRYGALRYVVVVVSGMAGVCVRLRACAGVALAPISPFAISYAHTVSWH